jgi:hypothetical protein
VPTQKPVRPRGAEKNAWGQVRIHQFIIVTRFIRPSSGNYCGCVAQLGAEK